MVCLNPKPRLNGLQGGFSKFFRALFWVRNGRRRIVRGTLNPKPQTLIYLENEGTAGNLQERVEAAEAPEGHPMGVYDMRGTFWGS